MIRNYEQIKHSTETHKEQLIDARPRDDFNKENSILGENRIPKAINVPYPELFDINTGTIKDNNLLLECTFFFKVFYCFNRQNIQNLFLTKLSVQKRRS